MSTGSVRPILFLDVDGVLNVDDDNPDTDLTGITVPTADLPISPFIRKFNGDEATVTYRRRGVHQAMLGVLAEQFELVWATTWEHLANRYVSPLYELGDLRYVKHSDTKPKFSMDVTGWKLDGIERFAGSTPWAWVDDSAWRYPSGDDGSLILAPDPAIGLTDDHVERLLIFVKQVT